MDATIIAADKGKTLSSKRTVTIIGNANAGKSTLLNKLSERDVSIVHHISGTTRDIILSSIVMGCLNIDFFDTAGIRETSNEVEAEGIRKGLTKAKNSELVLFCIDAVGLDCSQIVNAQRLLSSEKIPDERIIFVFTKVDLMERSLSFNNKYSPHSFNSLEVSARTGQGIVELRKRLVNYFQNIDDKQNDTEVIFLRKRSIDNLKECQTVIKASIENAKSNSLDLVAEDLRIAQNKLLEITGSISNEDILEKIFSKFCIGK